MSDVRKRPRALRWVVFIGIGLVLYCLVAFVVLRVAVHAGTPEVAWSQEFEGCDRADVDVHHGRIYIKRIFDRMKFDIRHEDLLCLDLDGNQLWSYDGYVNNYFVAGDNSVYVGHNSVVSLSPDGEIRWQTEEQPRSVIMIPWAISDAGYLYVRNGDPRHYIFDLEGNLLWQDDPDERVANGDPAWIGDDGTVYLYRGGYLRAIHPLQGELWRKSLALARPQRLTSGNLLSESQGIASCYSPDGTLQWQYNIINQSQSNTGGSPNRYNSTSCLASGTGVIYFSRFVGALHCLDEDGNELWRRQAGPGRFGGFSFLNVGPQGNVYATESSEVLCIGADGKDVWRCRAKATTDISWITTDCHVMLRDSGHGIIPGGDKETYTMLDPAGNELWSYTVKGHFPRPQPCPDGRAVVVKAYDSGGNRVWPHDEPDKVVLEMLQ